MKGSIMSFVSSFLRNKLYLYLMEKRTVIVVKQVKMMVRELKYMKNLPCGGMGQQWTATGAGALGAADLGMA